MKHIPEEERIAAFRRDDLFECAKWSKEIPYLPFGRYPTWEVKIIPHFPVR
jgi:hypothetical protein